MRNIIIAGHGNIGKYMEQEFTSKDIKTYIYDIKYTYNEILNLTDYIDACFICVPTEYINNDLDTTNIINAIDMLKDKTNLFVIKSTIPIGFMQKLNTYYPNLHFVYSPEYYGTTIHSNKIPNFVVLAGDTEDTKVISELYHIVKNRTFRITYTDYTTAEIAKFMENVFLATKVTFCAEFFKVCEKLDADYNKLREIFVLDERMGDSHTYIDSKQPYWSSHCLNKDVPAFINECSNMGIDLIMLKAMYQSNKYTKEEYQ